MHHTTRVRLTAAALAVFVTACDRELPTNADTGHTPAPTAAASADRHAQATARLERIARRMARAMADPAFRRQVKAELDQSPVVEHKVHFQRFLHGAGSRALREVARLNGEPESSVIADVDSGMTLEMYFPVPAHRAAWHGDTNLLVATALADHDVPIGYDVQGRRHVLSADTPPPTPVLAVEPAETDFDHPTPSLDVTCTQMKISAACTSTGGTTSTTTFTSGLYMSKSHLAQTFEGIRDS